MEIVANKLLFWSLFPRCGVLYSAFNSLLPPFYYNTLWSIELLEGGIWEVFPASFRMYFLFSGMHRWISRPTTVSKLPSLSPASTFHPVPNNLLRFKWLLQLAFVCLFISGDIKIVEQIYSLTGMVFAREKNTYIKFIEFPISPYPLEGFMHLFLKIPNTLLSMRCGDWLSWVWK